MSRILYSDRAAEIIAWVEGRTLGAAERMLSLRSGLDLHAERGGKNSIIVTRLVERDLVVRDIVDSAFGHAGQKCSACSLAIVEAELYDEPEGLHSLDLREQRLWTQKIVADILYINRTITGAIVQRQPFGGCKASSYGGGNKAGGPNYLIQLMRPEQRGLPREGAPVNRAVARLSRQPPLRSDPQQSGHCQRAHRTAQSLA